LWPITGLAPIREEYIGTDSEALAAIVLNPKEERSLVWRAGHEGARA
jgi:hypothetical protein